MNCSVLVLALLILSLPALAQTAAVGSLERGLELQKTGRHKEAQVLFEEALRAEPQNAEVQYQLAGSLVAQGHDAERAVALLEALVTGHDEVSKYHRRLGMAYYLEARDASMFGKMRLMGKLKSEFERAVEVEPSSIESRTALKQFYTMAPGVVGGSISKAKVQAIEIGRLDPYLGALALAVIHQHEKEPAKAEEYFKKALALAADGKQQGGALNALGYLHLSRDRVDEALLEFQKAVAADPTNPNSFDSLGEGLVAKGKADEAIASYGKALALDSRFYPSILGVGRAQEKAGRIPQALEAYRALVAQAPESGLAGQARQRIEALEKK